MKCSDCEGKGFKEYDAGLLQIGCKTCSGIGKVDEVLTKEEFEKAYAFRSDMTVDQVFELGLVAMPSDCPEGWAMENSPELGIDIVESTIEELPEGWKDKGVQVGGFLDDDPSNSRVGEDNQPTRSGNPGQSSKPKKSKAKKKARK